MNEKKYSLFVRLNLDRNCIALPSKTKVLYVSVPLSLRAALAAQEQGGNIGEPFSNETANVEKKSVRRPQASRRQHEGLAAYWLLCVHDADADHGLVEQLISDLTESDGSCYAANLLTLQFAKEEIQNAVARPHV